LFGIGPEATTDTINPATGRAYTPDEIHEEKITAAKRGLSLLRPRASRQQAQAEIDRLNGERARRLAEEKQRSATPQVRDLPGGGRAMLTPKGWIQLEEPEVEKTIPKAEEFTPPGGKPRGVQVGEKFYPYEEREATPKAEEFSPDGKPRGVQVGDRFYLYEEPEAAEAAPEAKEFFDVNEVSRGVQVGDKFYPWDNPEARIINVPMPMEVDTPQGKSQVVRGVPHHLNENGELKQLPFAPGPVVLPDREPVASSPFGPGIPGVDRDFAPGESTWLRDQRRTALPPVQPGTSTADDVAAAQRVLANPSRYRTELVEEARRILGQ